MSVPPLRLGNNFDSYISGEVIIHPSAAIAPGVILQATPNGKIIIGSGVCIGMGSILQVEQGTLEIGAGANLGAGFLMVGEGKVGENACIGSATTLFYCSVERGQIVTPGSILGDTSRAITKPANKTGKTQISPSTAVSPGLSLETTGEEQVDIEVKIETKDVSEPVIQAKLETKDVSEPVIQAKLETKDVSEPVVQTQMETTDTEQLDTSPEEIDTSTEKVENSEPAMAPPESFGAHIYGQGSIQQLLITLFPHRQSQNKPLSDDQSD
ncbi:MAG: transferase [Calothrix sp. MO_167.B42]|nr:transferase [Calothrix sp. MO_167.B42]